MASVSVDGRSMSILGCDESDATTTGAVAAVDGNGFWIVGVKLVAGGAAAIKVVTGVGSIITSVAGVEVSKASMGIAVSFVVGMKLR